MTASARADSTETRAPAEGEHRGYAEILRIAEKTSADIIVVGRRRGHTPHLLGALSTKLVRAAAGMEGDAS